MIKNKKEPGLLSPWLGLLVIESLSFAHFVETHDFIPAIVAYLFIFVTGMKIIAMYNYWRNIVYGEN